jgi:Txe/YoeB family toxin of Txe-Axe toxin-antitoxin module
VAAFEGLKKIKMEDVAMVTKVQKMLNSLQTADPFET